MNMFPPPTFFNALFSWPYAKPKEDACQEAQSDGSQAGYGPAKEELREERNSQDHQYYDIVQVVALYWRGKDQETFEKEAEMVVKTSKRLGWAAIKLSIPPDGKIRDLIRQTLDFSPRKGEKGLFILHYGGHGSKVRRTLQGAPSRDGFGDPAIDMRTYQSIIKEQVDYDMLGVFDGCNLGFEGWSDSIGERNSRCIEILTAGGTGVETPGPGDSKSFTPIFLEELEEAIHQEGPVTVNRLRHRLISRNQLVVEPNCLGASKNNERSIYLGPLRSYQQMPQCPRTTSEAQDSSKEATPNVSTRVSYHQLPQDPPTTSTKEISIPRSKTSGMKKRLLKGHEPPEINGESFPRQILGGKFPLAQERRRISASLLRKKAKRLVGKLKYRKKKETKPMHKCCDD